jgi:hypothetical protein
VSGIPSYQSSTQTVNLDKLKAWTIQVKIKDKFDEVTVTKVVSVGQPLMFMDANKKSVGINMIPTVADSFEVTGMYKQANAYINFNNTALVANDGGANGATDSSQTNFDHIWHDDNTNTWHFVSDNSFKTTGNSKIKSGSVDTGDITGTSLDVGSGSMVGRLNHKNGYFYLNSYSVGTYGDGYIRGWYNKNGNQLNLNSMNADNTSIGGIMKIHIDSGYAEVITSSGSNANGSWVKYESGLMICWLNQSLASPTTFSGSISHPIGGYYMYISGTWTFPQAFNNTPVVFVTGDFNGAYTEHHQAWATSTTVGNYENGIYWSAGIDTTTRPALNRCLLAIGWWK